MAALAAKSDLTPTSGVQREGVNHDSASILLSPVNLSYTIGDMAEQFWLVKQEPESYSWSRFVADGGTAWTGIRSFEARNNLRAMKPGDRVLFYHSVTGKVVVGIARVKQSAYADPTATKGDWSCVDLEPLMPLVEPVPLAALKADPLTARMKFIRQSQLSVTPVSPAEFRRILELGKTRV